MGNGFERGLRYCFEHGRMLEGGVDGVELEKEKQVGGWTAIFVIFRNRI